MDFELSEDQLALRDGARELLDGLASPERVRAHTTGNAPFDGVLWRVTLRELVVPILASMAIVAVLAVQEFSVYEPTGISVVATEVRAVFETGVMNLTPAQWACLAGAAFFGFQFRRLMRSAGHTIPRSSTVEADLG